ncbi:MAG: PilZ domain-containing protein [Pirellulales bacterium]|nr:PilZ domain-containing protein [Pirellulales bacterium]
MKFLEPAGSVKERVRQTVARLLAATTPSDERRAAERTPHFCTAVLSWDDDAVRMPAFVRDISHEGVGFFHSTPIELGELTATFMLNDADASLCREDIIRLRVRISWCRRCGESWYISGGPVIDVVDTNGPF